MRLVAREFNQSETTFLLPRATDAPPGACGPSRRPGRRSSGRATTRSAHGGGSPRPAGSSLRDGAGSFTQQLGDRVLPVDVLAGDDGRPVAIAMQQGPPRFGATVAQTEPLTAALGLAAGELRTDVPAQVVDTGAAHLLVPAVDRNAVDRAQPDAPALLAELSGRRRSGLLPVLARPAGAGRDGLRALLQSHGRDLGGPRNRQRRRAARLPAGRARPRRGRHDDRGRAGIRDGTPGSHPGRCRRRVGAPRGCRRGRGRRNDV